MSWSFKTLPCKLLDEHVSHWASIDPPFQCPSHMGQEVWEGLLILLDKVAKLSRGVLRGANHKGLKSKVSMGKISMQSK